MTDDASSPHGASDCDLSEQPAATPPPADRYDRLGIIGAGGMGRVFLARDRWLGRMVALKECLDERLAARLAREVRVTAGLEHPGIVTVYDEGRGADGRMFYTMRLMRGRPLSHVLRERASLSSRLELLPHYLDACHALAYAHAQGVVHRDIKPANVMLGAYGETQVVDWGLARRLLDAADPDTEQDATRRGAVLGTPAYMSPEQARGDVVDRRADVWSLGVVLHELLTGDLPRAPSGPSTGSSDTPPRAPVPREAPAELAAIVTRATSLDLATRYPDAGSLAADVAAYLAGRRVEAHRYTALEIGLRFLRAWRIPLSIAAAALVVIAALVVLGTLRLRAQRDRAVVAEEHTRAALVASDHNLAAALIAQARAADERGEDANKEVLAAHALRLGDSPEARGLLSGARAAGRPLRRETATLPECQRLAALAVDDILCADDTSLRRITAGVEQWRADTGKPIRELRVEHDRVFAFSRGNRMTTLWLATGAPDDEAWSFLDYNVGDSWPLRAAAWAPTSPPLPPLTWMCPGSHVEGVDGLLDGRHAALCADGRVGLARLTDPPIYIDAFDRAEFVSFTHMQLSPDAHRVVVAGAKGRLASLDVVTGEVHHVTQDRSNPARQLVMAPDGRRVAVVRERGGVELFTLPELRPLGRIAAASVHDLRIFADDTVLVAEAGRATRWALPAAPRPRLFADAHGLASVAFAPDGRTLLTTHGEGRALVWDIATGERRHALTVSDGTVKAGAFLSSSDRFAVVDAGTGPPGPQIFDVATGALVWSPPHSLLAYWYEVRSFDLSPGKPLPLVSRRVVTLADDLIVFALYAPGVLAFDVDTAADVPTTDCPVLEWIDLAASPDGERAALVAVDGAVHSLTGDTPLRCKPLPAPPSTTSADISADGMIVALGGDRFIARSGPDGVLWRAPHPGSPYDVALSPDGRWIASAGPDDVARVFATETGSLRAVLSGHTARVSSVEFSHDGALLATASWDGTARLWDMTTLDAPVQQLVDDAASTWGLALADVLSR